MYPLEFKWKINIALGKIKKVIGEITREVERKGEIEINLDVWGEESSWLEVFAGMIKKIKKKKTDFDKEVDYVLVYYKVWVLPE